MFLIGTQIAVNAQDNGNNSVIDNANPMESLCGEWWLVGWNDEGVWFEVDTNYVSHRKLSIEISTEGLVMAYSMVNEIYLGDLTLNGNEMIFTGGRGMTKVYGNIMENLFFEDHIFDIKSFQLEGNQLRLYYADEDYFVFTKDFDDSEERYYEWKNGPADPYISEVTAMSDEEVEVKIVQCPSYVTFYSRTVPPRGSSDICRFATSDLAGLSFEVGDKVAFRITRFKIQKVEKGREYQLKVEPSEGSEHITNRMGKMHNDRRMGWIIIDDNVNAKQGGIYYYPLRKLAEDYLTESLPVRISGGLYPTWKTPWDNKGNSDCYYMRIDDINSLNNVTFAENQMATIILPTTPDASKGKYYRLDRSEKGKIIFEQEPDPKARVPYIIVPKEDFTIDLSTLDLAGLSQDTVTIKGISFIGSYTSEELESKEGWYVDIIDTTPDCSLSPSGETEKGAFRIGALRAYLSWEDPYSQGPTKGEPQKKEIVLHDNPNGISEELRVKSEESANAIYDLSGRKVNAQPNSQFSIFNSQLKKGLYIVNGKRVVVK